MREIVLPALLATIGTWLITALGAATVIFFNNPKQKILNVLLGFSAGVMIAASFWSLLAPAIEQAERFLHFPAYLAVFLGFCAGAVFMWLCDKITCKIQKRHNRPTQNRSLLLVLSITLHNVPEGLAIGVAFGALGANPTKEAFLGAVSVAVGIGLQNFPEGAAVSLPLRRDGYSRLKSFLIGQGSALVEPIFGVLGAILVVFMQRLLPFALSFAAGAMVLVAVHELIPECQKDNKNQPYLATAGIILGFAVMMLLDVALG